MDGVGKLVRRVSEYKREKKKKAKYIIRQKYSGHI